jgi:hypothetical protein
MNSSPMILRLRSGSSTPGELARKRSSASTWTSGIPNWSKASTTCSASFIRIRPWSTKTQVSLLPHRPVDEQRRDRGVDAAGRGRRSPSIPTWAWIFATCSAITDCGDHCCSQPATSRRKRVEDLGAVGVWTTSGWNWIP